MKTLKESILSSTGTGKNAVVLSYLKSHSIPYVNSYGIDETEKYVLDYTTIQNDGTVDIERHSLNGISALSLIDNICTKLPVKFGNLGCPLILNMNKLNSEEGMPESVRSYFYCFNNEIEEIHYLPYIKYPLHGCVVFEIGGPKLRRIHCNYRGDTLRGNAYLYIYVDSTMPKEQFDLLMNDIQTHFEFHKVLKGKYSIFVKDCNSKAVIWSFKH